MEATQTPPPVTAAGPPAGYPESPYPGLRPFKRSEAPLFFGRSKERIRLLELLETQSFLAVLGSSGSGKSSLVLSGLVPDLSAGKLLTSTRTEFHFTDFRPSTNPYGALAEKLLRGPLQGVFSDPFFVEERLRRSPRGLAQLLGEQWPKSPDQTTSSRALVLVVDQFEEIFRFAGLTEAVHAQAEGERESRDFANVAGELNEAQAFVDLLLASARSREVRIFVVLTMRSDFYRHCEVFEGLPEMVAANQYLTPRMTRAQLEDAIRLPLRPYGWELDDAVVNWMLNDVHGESDQLPILQHALSRMWSNAHAGKEPTPPVLTPQHYQNIGLLQGALNQHGDGLITDHKLITTEVAALFRCLGDFDRASGAAIRRPRTVGQVVKESGLTQGQVVAIANIFRAREASFLMPPADEELTEVKVLDLSHECLLRKWTALIGWMEAERQLGRMLGRLHDRATELGWDGQRNASRSHLSWVEIQRYREFFPKRGTWPEGWAERYQCALKSLLEFLRREEQTVRAKRMLAALAVFAVLAVPLVIWADTNRTKAALLDAEQRTNLAEKKRVEAEKVQAAAELRIAETARAREQEAAQQKKALDEAVSAALQSQGEAAARTEEMSGVAKDLLKVVEKNAPTALNPEWQTRLRQLGLIEIPRMAPPNVAIDYRLSQTMSFGPAKEPVTSVALVGAGTADLALVSGSDRLRFRDLFKEERDDSLGRPAWTQSATTLSLSAFADSPESLVATNGGPDFAWCDVNLKWTTVSTNSGGVARGRFISGHKIVFCTVDGNIGLWNTAATPPAQPALFKTPHTGTINDVVANPASTLLLSSGDDSTVMLWKTDGATVELVEKLACGAPVRSAAFSPDGARVLLPSGERVIRLIELGRPQAPFSTGKTMLLSHDQPVISGAFSPDGRWLVTADTSGAISLWAANTPVPAAGTDPTPEAVVRGHRERVTSLAWSPTGAGWVSADKNGTVLLWRLNLGDHATATPIAMPPHRGIVDALAWATDGSAFVTGSFDRTARIYPTRSVIRGTYKTFGGPTQSQQYGSGLALLNEADAGAPQYAGLFLPNADPKATLSERLNPDAAYVAARWDYGTTPRNYLRGIKVTVRNVKTGASKEAQPVDWGPAEKTGKAADLSPGLARDLGLGPNDEVELDIPLLGAWKKALEMRTVIARQILQWEGQRDAKGHLKILQLPVPDDGGAVEVAGFRDRYSPKVVAELTALIKAGRYDEAEAAAISAIADYTDRAGSWATNPGLEAYLRDTAFYLSPVGAARVLQMALGVPADGVVGALTLSQVSKRERDDPAAFLLNLHNARQTVMRDWAGVQKSKGLESKQQQRMTAAFDYAKSLL